MFKSIGKFLDKKVKAKSKYVMVKRSFMKKVDDYTDDLLNYAYMYKARYYTEISCRERFQKMIQVISKTNLEKVATIVDTHWKDGKKYYICDIDPANIVKFYEREKSPLEIENDKLKEKNKKLLDELTDVYKNAGDNVIETAKLRREYDKLLGEYEDLSRRYDSAIYINDMPAEPVGPLTVNYFSIVEHKDKKTNKITYYILDPETDKTIRVSKQVADLIKKY